MRAGTIAFLFGLLLFHRLPELPPRWWGVGILIALPFLLRASKLRLLAWFITGFLWALLLTPPAPPLQLPTQLESVDLEVEGWVASIPQTFSRSVRFQLQIDSLHSNRNRPILTRGKIQLAWYSHDVPSLRFGDKWRLVVRLKRPHRLANPGAFDFERWWFRNGIMARGYVREQPTLKIESTRICKPMGTLKANHQAPFVAKT